MNNSNIKQISDVLKLISDALHFIFKSSIGIGILLFVVYLHKIKIMPKGLTIGDGLFFLLLSVSFGFIYMFIYTLNVFLVSLVFNIINKILKNKALFKLRLITNNNITFEYIWNQIEKIFSHCIDVLIYIKRNKNILDLLIVLFKLLVIVIVMGSSYLFYYLIGHEYILILASCLLLCFLINSYNKFENKYVYWILCVFTVILPLIYGDKLTKTFIEKSFNMIGARYDKTTNINQCAVLIDNEYLKDYNDVIGSYFKLSNSKFTRIDNATILLSGIGTDTILQLDKNDKHVTFAIPSDKLMIVKDDIDAKNNVKRLIADELIKIFGNDNKQWSIKIDTDELRITFTSSDSLYVISKYRANNDFSNEIKSFIPIFVKTLVKYEKDIESINIEGYSSREWRKSTNNSDAYLNNLSLSFNRAYYITSICLNNLNEPEKRWLASKLNSVGWSSNKLVDSNVDTSDKKSRRITFKINIK